MTKQTLVTRSIEFQDEARAKIASNKRPRQDVQSTIIRKSKKHVNQDHDNQDHDNQEHDHQKHDNQEQSNK